MLELEKEKKMQLEGGCVINIEQRGSCHRHLEYYHHACMKPTQSLNIRSYIYDSNIICLYVPHAYKLTASTKRIKFHGNNILKVATADSCLQQTYIRNI